MFGYESVGLFHDVILPLGVTLYADESCSGNVDPLVS